MTNTKNDIYNILVTSGRNLVSTKGASYLTARKLSEASNYSVGTIYNQFLNMDNYIIVQNMITLDEIYAIISRVSRTPIAYDNINKYLDVFMEYVYQNSNLWFLFYEFHLRKHDEKLPSEYIRKIAKLMNLVFVDFSILTGNVELAKTKLLRKVLWLSLFSLSPFLTNDLFESFRDIRKDTACRLLLNTYLAGVSSLAGEE